MNIKKNIWRIWSVFNLIFRTYPRSIFFYLCFLVVIYLSISIGSPWPFLWFLISLVTWPILLALFIITIAIPFLVKLFSKITQKYWTTHYGDFEEEGFGYRDRGDRGFWPYRW
jgi:hypothetical protein